MEDFTSKENMEDHLAAFGHFISSESRRTRFDGAIIRLPLRTQIGAQTSELVPQAFTVNDIKEMFSEFVAKELAVVLLFLSNLSSIELLVRDDNGCKHLASVEIDRSNGSHIEETIAYSKSIVTVLKGEHESSRRITYAWNLFHGSISEDDAAGLLSKRLGRAIKTSNLSEEKMLPEIALAFPTAPFGVGDGEIHRMGLFTFLPLPIPTEFPCHVHALFALTPDRQKLLNPNETRLKGSRDESVHQIRTVYMIAN
jgi:hypothetical protein